jgi:hypothetical protein
MNKQLRAVLSAAALLGLSVSGANAQVSEDGMGKVLPVELFACSFNDGQDADDLESVIRRWTRFMDEKNITSYAAWTLTPVYYSPAQEFDMIWMGAWTDGNAMGSGSDTWMSEGTDIAEAFAEVVDCGAHVGLASAMYKSPPNNETPRSSIITMMDCELNEGKRYSDIRAAEIKWAKYLADSGSTAGYWHWFPTYGGGDAEYDYKVVFAYSSFGELGADWERGANGGGREAAAEIFGDIDECDDARVYAAQSRRAAQLR